ncbi:MAG: response regulator transcription factor [Anaerolineae bacterium]|nr:response regulator transcription factor [Anaerolineae bacterium]
MIRVVICDDQEIVRQGLRTILNADPSLTVIDTAEDGLDLLEKLKSIEPDIILMDLKMPVMNGVQATRQVRQQYPAVKVLILTTYDDDEWLFDALKSGASGYLLKDTPGEKLREAIIGTVSGESHLDPSIAGKVVQAMLNQQPRQMQKTNIDLSQREQEILTLMAQGLSNADIARSLFLSEGTVRNYTSNIFSKLGVSDRTQAVITALRLGLVDLHHL